MKRDGRWRSSDPMFTWSDSELQARFVLLLHLNQMLLRVLPLIDLSPRDEAGWVGSAAGAAVRVRQPSAASERWRGPSLGRWMRAHRACLFRGTKLSHWNDMLRATTTPTALSQVRRAGVLA